MKYQANNNDNLNIKNTDLNDVPVDFDSKHQFSGSDLLKDVAKQGFKAIMAYSTSIILFGITNITIFIFWLYKSNNILNEYFIKMIICLIFGILFTFLAISFTNKFILLDTIRVAYKHLESFFERLCTKIIDIVVNNGNNITGKDIHSFLNIKSLMIQSYGEKMPKILQKALFFLINKIPFSDFLIKMHENFKQIKDQRKLSYILYSYLNNYIQNDLLGNVSMKWIFWLYPLNVTIHIILFYI